jgi:hypothetical protein
VPYFGLGYSDETISVLPNSEAEVEVFVIEKVPFVKEANLSQHGTVQEHGTTQKVVYFKGCLPLLLINLSPRSTSHL